MTDDKHEFGGPWTEVKLDVLQEYARFFTTALKNQSFELWYIDAFAGTGRRTTKKEVGGLFDGAPVEVTEESLEGSARRAISIQPEFHHLVLIDERPKHYDALSRLAREFPERDIRPVKGDANTALRSLFTAPPWDVSSEAWRQRALLFLDPYGINVRWQTLEMVAATERADVWYLVNLKGVVQQLAHDHSRLDDTKRRSLGAFFGTADWEDRFYECQASSADLFSNPIRRVGSRAIGKAEVAAFYGDRLKSLFRYVSPPLGLAVTQHEDYFQLYCLSNNPRPGALALIQRGAEAVLAKHDSASRRMSGR